FNAGEFPGDADTEPIVTRLSHTDFFGQKGIAILREGEGDGAQAALLRFGQALNHGHYDDLNLNYFALGEEVTYDLGYSLGSTHTQVGWARQTASHNLVVVNETRQHAEGCGTGGDLLLLAELPGLRLVEADATAAYAGLGVDEYRRTLALVGEGEDAYLVDLFRVSGGQQHDYMFHCAGEGVQVEGVELGEAEPGSLAGPDYDWGHRQLNDANMSGVPSTPYWNPPPGNGYGFLVDVRRGAADGSWTATWDLDPGREASVRLHALPQPGTEVITAGAPGIYPHFPRAAYVCARRTGEDLRSEFACVVETSAAARHSNVHRASRILAGARATAGVIKPISPYDLVLFQAEAAGDRMTFPVTVPADGDYRVVVGHYLSPSYGEMRLLIDGEPVGEALRGTGSTVQPAEPAVLGTLRLSAGEHSAALEAVAPDADAGRYWLGISFVAFDPVQAEGAPAGPRITRVDRLAPDAGGPGIGVRVVGADGVTDHIFSAPDAAERTWGEMTVAARFARVRTDADGRLLAANLVGGSRLVACGVTVELPADAWRAQVVEVDEPAREVVLDAPLPEGEALRGQTILFDNSGYSRNTAYHIERVTVAGGRSRVRVREATFTLGKALLDEAPLDDHTITTLVPHEYARTLARVNVPPELNFFRGKLLQSADGGFATTIREVQSGQPMHIIADQVTELSAGDELYYRDVRPGDEALVHCSATLLQAGEGEYRVQSNAPVKLTGARIVAQ
ncbi:MAG TPA: heparinase II/III family protein, partial [Armatimonadota bacterium]|nr:heparinase II/III family protein [Armatimonadota bacterium]